MKNKKGLIITAVVVVVVLIIAGFFISNRNKFYTLNQKVTKSSSTISTQLQRRADLIPNFVATVKGYSDYEQSTYTAVTEARSAVSKAANVSEQQAASEQLDKAISVWVNAVTEAYPELKANTQYTALTDELAGTENRITVARKDYNDSVEEYNNAIGRFPGNMVASMFGYKSADYFEADPAASSVPQVSFD